MTIQERLFNLRTLHNLTQTTVSDILEISQQVYSGYETGRHELPIHHLIRLAEYYHVSTDYLLCLTDSRH